MFFVSSLVLGTVGTWLLHHGYVMSSGSHHHRERAHGRPPTRAVIGMTALVGGLLGMALPTVFLIIAPSDVVTRLGDVQQLKDGWFIIGVGRDGLLSGMLGGGLYGIIHYTWAHKDDPFL
jgi:hypothetical protein